MSLASFRLSVNVRDEHSYAGVQLNNLSSENFEIGVLVFHFGEEFVRQTSQTISMTLDSFEFVCHDIAPSFYKHFLLFLDAFSASLEPVKRVKRSA